MNAMQFAGKHRIEHQDVSRRSVIGRVVFGCRDPKDYPTGPGAPRRLIRHYRAARRGLPT